MQSIPIHEPILDILPDPIIVINAKQEVIHINPAAIKFFGRDPELIGKTCCAIFSCPFQQLTNCPLNNNCSAQKIWEATIAGKAFEVSAIAHPDPQKSQDLTILLLRDIDQLKQIEDNHKAINRLLLMLSAVNETLVRAVNEQQFLKDLCQIIVTKGQYRLVWVGNAEFDSDRTVRPIAHYGFDDGYLSTIKISWADNQWGNGPTGKAIRTEQPSICRNIQVDPHYLPWREEAKKRGFHSSIALPLINNKTPLGVLNIYSDDPNCFDEQEIKFLTELAGDVAWGIQSLRTRQQHLEALETIRESDAMLKAIFNAANDGILVADAETKKFLTANQTIGNMLGYTLAEITKLGINDIHPKEDLPRILDIFDRQFKKEISVAENIPVKRKNGSLFLADISTSPTIINNRLCAIGIFRDNTNKRCAEERLLQSQKMEAIGTLAGGIAHDFNNILSPIFGYTEVLLDQVEKDSTHRKYLAEILIAARRARDLVKQILTFSRKGVEERKPLLLQPLIKESLKLLRASLPSTIDIQQEIDSNCGPVMADPSKISQLLVNLCTNAFHAMREHGGLLQVTLRDIIIEGKNPANSADPVAGHYVELIIQDTGHGMTPEILDHIFEPYFTTKIKEDGTGLGLSVVHGIVINHKGYIKVKSLPNKGTSFSIFLPVVQTEPVSQKPTPQILPRGSEHILVVDDEEPIACLIHDMLTSLGYRVTAATDSREALATFQNRPQEFNLVITDLTMPNMTGLDLALALRKTRPDIPLILTSGFPSQHTEAKAKAIGIQASIMKPISLAALSQTIRNILDGFSKN